MNKKTLDDPSLDIPDGMVRQRQTEESIAEIQAQAKEWFPLFGAAVRDKRDGQEGTLWGVTGRGLICSFPPHGLHYCIDPSLIERI